MNKTKFKLKTYNPINPGLRFKKNLVKNILAKKNRLIKTTSHLYHRSYGRCSLTGQITVRHRGGNKTKALYTNINLKNNKQPKNYVTIYTTYDKNRSAFINLNFDLVYKNFFYNTAVNKVFPGTVVKNAFDIDEIIQLGYRSLLRNLPIGSLINNLTIDPTFRAKYIRAAGTYGIILRCDHTAETAKIKLPSKTIIEIPAKNFATVGQISNLEQNLIRIGKAGINRHLGKRPYVRGICMNPVDHPNGGRTNKGKQQVSPWGFPAKGGYYRAKKLINK